MISAPLTAAVDFYVTAIEADGSQTTFTVAYTTLPQLVRAGQWNYQLSAGKYHDGADGYAPALMQSSLSYGLNNTFTLYGGAPCRGELSRRRLWRR